jgi:hypothetical protein
MNYSTNINWAFITQQAQNKEIAVQISNNFMELKKHVCKHEDLSSNSTPRKRGIWCTPVIPARKEEG